ncbi:glycosyltransferase [Paenibacillus glacialis]|uniref:Glycosyltransferase n=1 Tax=Paenibacillus glacialis TaxID=494026 RepID=A0A168JMR9_9BACL|nr:glycosyltransferase [Paenibacillus glacialis]OAB40849.1 glycosyltransferase [Paenibacillus glacialis]
MKRKFLKLTMLCVILIASVAPLNVQAMEHEQSHAAHKECLSPSQVKLKEDLRRLWIDHVVWTRSYIVSAIEGLGDQQKVLERLLRNQQDIGDAIKPYYGEEAGNKLAEILRGHILLAGKVLDAAKSGNQANLEKYNKEWHRNADDIAKFLSSVNPHWSEKEIKDMMYEHLQLIIDDVTARLKKDWDAETIAFDKGVDHMVEFADILTNGIVKQFPDRFK